MSDSYPYEEGNVVVLGPELFASKDGATICWKGRNYVPMEDSYDPSPGPANWTCQIGEVPRDSLPDGCDLPMRNAVERAYIQLTGQTPDFIFSGWGDPLPERYRAVVEDRQPQ